MGISRDDFGRLDVATTQGIVEVADEIAKAGGVAIAAHIDASRGFIRMINSGPERKRGICCTEPLGDGSRRRLSAGRVSIRHEAWISSDACRAFNRRIAGLPALTITS